MNKYELTKKRMVEGVWEGVLTGVGDETPQISASHLGEDIPDVAVEQSDGAWLVRVTIPASAVADGVQTILICDARDDSDIGSITLIGGEVLGGDMRAELDRLRTELEVLKRAFRRHCAESE